MVFTQQYLADVTLEITLAVSFLWLLRLREKSVCIRSKAYFLDNVKEMQGRTFAKGEMFKTSPGYSTYIALKYCKII